MEEHFKAVFELTFKKFITPKLAPTIFVLGIVCLAGYSLVILRRYGLGFLFAPVFFLFSVLFLRMIIESLLALFQIARYNAEVARRGRPEGEVGDNEL